MNFRILAAATLLTGATIHNIRSASLSVTMEDPGFNRRNTATEALSNAPIKLLPPLIAIVNGYIPASKYVSRTWQAFPGEGIVETRKRYNGTYVPKTIISEKEMVCLSEATVRIIISPKQRVLLFATQKNKTAPGEVYVGYAILKHPRLRYGTRWEQLNGYYSSTHKMISAMSFKAIKYEDGSWQTGIWHEGLGPIKGGDYNLKSIKNLADYHSKELSKQAHEYLSAGRSLESEPYYRQRLKAKTIKRIVHDYNQKQKTNGVK